ncbi:hypothetical protein CBR_g24196 [Chara braunii]|uniref:Myb-like domain-containing protein n=1 Tax=Chara braunii TaxID=69332 RepID=A0A388L618_CHABU|nr:hypothetical protein CBR_g24196 [Chara braunii]|eukprot:GBG77749.1 hypothetical protein CBR_g24196 [Chara braunii]
MADMVRKLALLIILIGVVVLLIALHACHLADARIRRGRRKGLKTLRQGASGSKGMGDEYTRGCEGFGMGRGAYGGGSGMQHNLHHRFDPNLYSHLPPHQQPLPDDTTWTPPPSTLGLAWGSTLTSYDTPLRVESNGGGVGPMSALLGETRGRGRHPFDSQLSPTATMDVSGTALVQRSGQGGGASTQTMHASVLDDGVSMHRPNHMSRPAPSKAAPAGSVPYHQPAAGAAMQDQRADVGGVAESPRCVERIVCRFNSLRATSEGDEAGAAMQERRPDLGGVAESPRCVERIVCRYNSSRPTTDGDVGGRDGGASEADRVDVEDDDGDEEDKDEAPLKEAVFGGTKKQPSKVRGKAKGKDKEGDTNGEGGGSGARGNWSLNESLVLVRCKRDQDDYFANAGTNFARMKTKDQKWMEIAKRMEKEGVRRDGEQCMKRWENIFGWYRKVWDREKASGLQSYFLMTTKAWKEKGYKFNLDRTLYDAIHIMQGNNQAVHPPNLMDTGNTQGQQSQQGEQSQAATGGGEADTSASENRGADTEDGCGSRSSSNGIQGKWKNARQLAFEAVTDVMKTHSTVVAESVDRASKRQCDVLQRYGNSEIVRGGHRGVVVTEVEIEHCSCVRVRRCASMDIQVALRGRVLSRTITFYEMRHRRGEKDGRLFDFVGEVSGQEVRHYEVDTNGDTILNVIVALGYVDEMLREVVGYATKVRRAIPDRWEGGVDVLADIVDLLMSNIANEHDDHMTVPADFRVWPDPPLHDRPGLRGEIRNIDE